MKTRFLILTLLVLLTGSTAFCQASHYGIAQKTSNTVQKDADDDKVYEIKEPKDTIGLELPSFFGGPKAFYEYLHTHLGYPIVAQENNIQGKVIVSFIVEKSGFLSDIKVEKPVDPSLDREALRVVRSMPRWLPGKQDGVPVRCKFRVPVVFRLQKEAKK